MTIYLFWVRTLSSFNTYVRPHSDASSSLLGVMLTKDDSHVHEMDLGDALDYVTTPLFNFWSTGSPASHKFVRLSDNAARLTGNVHWHMLVLWNDQLLRNQMTHPHIGCTSRPLFFPWTTISSRRRK